MARKVIMPWSAMQKPPQRREMPRGKPTRATQCLKVLALKSTEVVEFHPSTKPTGETLTPQEDEAGTPESNYNDDPLVNGLITPITKPIELLILGKEKKVALNMPLDTGCIMCMISPTLVGKLGVWL